MPQQAEFFHEVTLNLKKLYPEVSTTEMWVMVFLVSYYQFKCYLTLKEFEEFVSPHCYDLRRV